MPLLLYHTSGMLRSQVIPELNKFLQNKWDEINNEYATFYISPLISHDPQSLKEAKRILIQLLLAGPKDKHVAVIPYENRLQIKNILVSVQSYNDPYESDSTGQMSLLIS